MLKGKKGYLLLIAVAIVVVLLGVYFMINNGETDGLRDKKQFIDFLRPTPVDCTESTSTLEQKMGSTVKILHGDITGTLFFESNGKQFIFISCDEVEHFGNLSGATESGIFPLSMIYKFPNSLTYIFEANNTLFGYDRSLFSFRNIDPKKIYLLGESTKYWYFTDGKKSLVAQEHGSDVNLTTLEEFQPDIQTFKILPGGYSKDKSSVYFINDKLAADPKSFRNVTNDFFRDDKSIYYKGYSDQNMVDPGSTFSIVSADQAGVVFLLKIGGKLVLFTPRLPGWLSGGEVKTQRIDTDSNTTRAISTSTDPWFFSDGQKGFFLGQDQDIGGPPIPYIQELNFDPATFKVVGRGYFRDKNYVYRAEKHSYGGQVTLIKGADPENFSPLNNIFSRDGKNVYYKYLKISAADPETFHPLSNSYSKDKNFVYIWDEILSGADPVSFSVIAEDEAGFESPSMQLVKDKNSLWYADKKFFEVKSPVVFYRSVYSDANLYFSDKDTIYAVSYSNKDSISTSTPRISFPIPPRLAAIPKEDFSIIASTLDCSEQRWTFEDYVSGKTLLGPDLILDSQPLRDRIKEFCSKKGR